MCMLEELPKNSESVILSKMFKWVKENRPDIKLIYTWADGILGKPGYVYQATNFLYGGFITTDLYLDFLGCLGIGPYTISEIFEQKSF